MSNAPATPGQPFYLVVTNQDRGVFSVEGPMSDDRPWYDAASDPISARRRCARCSPTGLTI